VDGHAVLILGLDMQAEAGEGGLLHGIEPSAIAGEHPALVGAILARETGIEVGDELAVLGQAADGSMANDLVRVTGILDTPMEEIDRTGIVMPIETVQGIFALPDQAHEITIRGDDPEDAEALAARIEALDGFSELETLPWRILAPEMAQAMGMMGAFSLVVLFIVFLAAAAGVANTMLMSTFERRRELGVLLALGTSPLRLVRMVLYEAVLLGLLGVTIGTLAGGGLILYFSHTGIDAMLGGGADAQDLAMFGVGVDPNVYPFLTLRDLVPGFVGIVIVSVLAALLPALATARLEPMEAMRS
jgi:ABC-type lipoprotein release transport system permease subunit